MARPSNARTAYSKLSSKSQTVLPREVRARLDLRPGDTVRYRIDERGVVLEKAPQPVQDDPFATFEEWSSAADEAAYGDL
jgi:antitoxin PrlF